MYDAAGRCVKLAENGSTPSYSGNAIKNFLWRGAERCEERDGSNTVVSVFSGLGQKTSGTNELYSFDHLGSIREVTNSSGTVQGAFDFDPYGNMSALSGSVKPDFGYTGIYQHSRTNLALTWFRQYNPGFGRWLSRDPLGESAGLNSYGYSDNNPISIFDPLGLWPKQLEKLMGLRKLFEWGIPRFLRKQFGIPGDDKKLNDCQKQTVKLLEQFAKDVAEELNDADVDKAFELSKLDKKTLFILLGKYLGAKAIPFKGKELSDKIWKIDLKPVLPLPKDWTPQEKDFVRGFGKRLPDNDSTIMEPLLQKLMKD